MKERTLLEEHYNKFSEEKRLTRRHGQVEYLTTIRYIHKYLEELNGNKNEIKIIDIGAGTGRYAIALAEEGYDVTAVELVKYNVGIMKSKNSNVKAYQGSALNLKKFKDQTYDVGLLFGPMYHLFTKEDKLKALSEAKRVIKSGGILFVAYLMADYSILIHGFRDNYIKESISNGKVNKDFSINNSEEDLYDYIRISQIDELNREIGTERLQMIAATGMANHMRSVLSAMDQETFEVFLEYHFATCEREDLLGASSHTVDILSIP